MKQPHLFKKLLFKGAVIVCLFLFAACGDDPKEQDIAVTGVSLNKTNLELVEGGKEVLVATIAPADATNKVVVWTSSDNDVATVAGSTVSAVAAGTATITVTTEDGGYTAACVVTVEAATIVVTGVTLHLTDTTVRVDDIFTLVPILTPDDATNRVVTWESNNGDIATVNQNGMVTAVSAGAATITVTTEDGGHTADCKVTVEAAEHSIFGIISFKSEKTWTVGDQVWSDVVMATGCKKNDFDGGQYYGPYQVDCRQNNDGYGDLFSYEAVMQYGDQLCPGEWRVPSTDDFCALDQALNEREDCLNRFGDADAVAKYIGDSWGGEYGGYCNVYNFNYQGYMATYWSSSNVTETDTHVTCFVFDLSNGAQPKGSGAKQNGFNLRCVK